MPNPTLIQITPISAFQDNYIWIMHDSKLAIVIDPGIADPVITFLEKQKINLAAILITHHHHDHVGGISKLNRQKVPVYGPEQEHILGLTQFVKEGDTVHLANNTFNFNVLAVPGHTLGHIVYYNNTLLFCGDTLFSAGCGRLFEGTAQQMYHSLQKIAALNDSIQIFCAHEYTLKNLQFAQHVEPSNPIIKKRIKAVELLRAKSQPTLPSTLALEKEINPFLRCHVPEVIERVEHYANKKLRDPVEVFAYLRQWKDHF